MFKFSFIFRSFLLIFSKTLTVMILDKKFLMCKKLNKKYFYIYVKRASNFDLSPHENQECG